MTWKLFICFLSFEVICLRVSGLTEKSHTTSYTILHNNNFYSNSCSADTYVPSIKTFSSVWAILNVIIFFCACLFYLRHLCIVKFISNLTK
uniref:Herpesvirus envelope glycoprotein N domain-containing protein n=1 Tax=Saimiriine herpesvirus 2 TaxID=10381 RepID=Q805G3_SHV2|nr:hypothetical protein [Saimiriine gammaherpesvirus 2]CAC85006.1 hypothetical protein [Saimiriine gammaherpesvirus 2]